ncbi:MAG TPA: hypothetical protein VMS02_06585 [Solirubrobacteraceae bacterium]|nr:hypothetical protein [Solirubrobacteraceae bacterium]
MTDGSSNKGLRDRIASGTEDRLGRALGDLLDNPLLNGALGRAADAREKATQAQEVAMGALNLPSAADMERLTRRLRSVSLRLEGIEDGVHRLGRVLPGQAIDTRLAAIEQQLGALSRAVGDVRDGLAAKRGEATPTSATRPATKPAAAKPAAAKAAAKPAAAKPRVGKRRPAAKGAATAGRRAQPKA